MRKRPDRWDCIIVDILEIQAGKSDKFQDFFINKNFFMVKYTYFIGHFAYVHGFKTAFQHFCTK